MLKRKKYKSMKAIERIALYLKAMAISPHSFEKQINLSNGYYAKQLNHSGSIGSDILVRIHEQYPSLNILWVLTGEGEMILRKEKSSSIAKGATKFTTPTTAQTPNQVPPASNLNERSMYYDFGSKKLKRLEVDLEMLNISLRDKEKIIGLYEFMLNNKTYNVAVTETK